MTSQKILRSRGHTLRCVHHTQAHTCSYVLISAISLEIVRIAAPFVNVHIHRTHHLQFERVLSHLANERTWLAWVRASLTLLSNAFTIYSKFGTIATTHTRATTPLPYPLTHSPEPPHQSHQSQRCTRRSTLRITPPSIDHCAISAWVTWSSCPSLASLAGSGECWFGGTTHCMHALPTPSITTCYHPDQPPTNH